MGLFVTRKRIRISSWMQWPGAARSAAFQRSAVVPLLLATLATIFSSGTALAQAQKEEPSDLEFEEPSTIDQPKQPAWALGEFPRNPGEYSAPDVVGISIGMPLTKALEQLKKYNKNLFYQRRATDEMAPGINGKFVISEVVAKDGSYELATRKGCQNGQIWERFNKKPAKLCWDSVHESITIFVGGLPQKEFVVGVQMHRLYTEDDINPVDEAPNVLDTRNALLLKYGYPTFYSDLGLGHSVDIGYVYGPDGRNYYGKGGRTIPFFFGMGDHPQCLVVVDEMGLKHPDPNNESGCGVSLHAHVSVSMHGVTASNLGRSKAMKIAVLLFDLDRWEKSRQERLAAIEKSEGRQKVRKNERKVKGF